MLDGHYFYIKKMDVLTQSWECEVCKQLFTRVKSLAKHMERECEGVKVKIICEGKKMKRKPSKSEKVFYADSYSNAACQWIECMSEKTGRHKHHALCSDGGEKAVKNGEGRECKVDSCKPITKTVYEYNGCKGHECLCQPNRTAKDEERYAKTEEKERVIRALGYSLVAAWECEKPPKKRCYLRKEFRAYPLSLIHI